MGGNWGLNPLRYIPSLFYFETGSCLVHGLSKLLRVLLSCWGWSELAQLPCHRDYRCVPPHPATYDVNHRGNWMWGCIRILCTIFYNLYFFYEVKTVLKFKKFKSKGYFIDVKLHEIKISVFLKSFMWMHIYLLTYCL